MNTNSEAITRNQFRALVLANAEQIRQSGDEEFMACLAAAEAEQRSEALMVRWDADAVTGGIWQRQVVAEFYGDLYDELRSEA